MTHVLHTSETVGAGVGIAIASIIQASPDLEHSLHYRSHSTLPTEVVHANLRSQTEVTTLTAYATSFRETVDRLQPDIIHAHSSWAGVVARVLSRGVPVVYSPHGLAFTRRDVGYAARLWFRATEKLLSHRTHSFLANGTDEARKLAALNPAATVHSLTFGTAEAVSRQDQTKCPASPTIAMVGRICTQKDPLFFLEVVEEARRSLPNLRAIWIGSPEAGSVGADLAAGLERGGVEVTGWLGRPELTQAISEVSVVVHSAAWEAGVPLSVLDACAQGKPVVVRRTNTTWDWPGAVTSSAKQISELTCSLLTDPELHGRVAAAQHEEALRCIADFGEFSFREHLYENAGRR